MPRFRINWKKLATAEIASKCKDFEKINLKINKFWNATFNQMNMQ